MTERWADVVGYEGRYQVSDQGRVRSVPGGRRLGVTLTPHPAPNGYLAVHLYRDGTRSTTAVHSLVTAAFIGTCPAGMEVRHLNGDQLDNKITNLTYGTHGQNVDDVVTHGRHYQANKTHCPSGHPYDDENTLHAARPNGRTARRCRLCREDTMRRASQKYELKRKAARALAKAQS
jgi:hypothetical protein